MTANKNSWVEQLYQYVEYYYWAPNDLNKQSIPGKTGFAELEEVRQKMRRNEVPLNAIFNISLRLLPSRITNRLLACFVVDSSTNFGDGFELVSIEGWGKDLANFTQPDVVLESDTTRVFIELKVNAPFSQGQVHKYVFLHALWNMTAQKHKKPYLFFLSPRELYHQWGMPEREVIFREGTSANDLLNYMRAIPLPIKLGNKESTTSLHEEASRVFETLELGSATWHSVGACLQSELERFNKENRGEDKEVIAKLIGDLLDELDSRKLWAR